MRTRILPLIVLIVLIMRAAHAYPLNWITNQGSDAGKGCGALISTRRVGWRRHGRGPGYERLSSVTLSAGSPIPVPAEDGGSRPPSVACCRVPDRAMSDAPTGSCIPAA